MQRYKYVMVSFLIIIVSVAAVLLYKGTRDAANMDSAEVTGESAAGQGTRIPKLEEGMDVYALENEIFSILGPDNVAVSTDRSSGSGILWQFGEKQLMIVTSAHLMADFTSGEVELWSGEKVTFEAKDVVTSGEYDVAVLTIPLEDKLKAEYTGAGSYAVENIPEIGDKMWILDSVYGAGSGIGNAQVSAVDIFLEDYGTEMLLLNGTGKTGMSGCPVYDEEGNLAGMISGMSEDGATLAAVPVSRIMKFLETLAE